MKLRSCINNIYEQISAIEAAMTEQSYSINTYVRMSVLVTILQLLRNKAN